MENVQLPDNIEIFIKEVNIEIFIDVDEISIEQEVE